MGYSNKCVVWICLDSGAVPDISTKKKYGDDLASTGKKILHFTWFDRP